MFLSSPPADSGPVSKYGRQDSQSSVSTIGRLAAAASTRIFPLDFNCFQEEAGNDGNHGLHQEKACPRQGICGSTPDPPTDSSGKQPQNSSQSDAILPMPCPSTIVTISGNLAKPVHNPLNPATYPVCCTTNNANPSNPADSSTKSLLDASSFTRSHASDETILGNSELYHGHHAPVSGSSGRPSMDARHAAKVLAQTSSNSGQTRWQGCEDSDSPRCPATELEPLSLAQTECSTFNPDRRKSGHVNQVYLPESPMSPKNREEPDSLNQQDFYKQSYQQNNQSNEGSKAKPAFGNQNMGPNTRNSKPLSSVHAGGSVKHPQQVHFDHRQVGDNLNIPEHGEEQRRPPEAGNVSAPKDERLFPGKASIRSGSNLRQVDETGQTANGVNTVNQFSSQSTGDKPNPIGLSSKPANNITSLSTSDILAISPEEHIYFDSNEEFRRDGQADKNLFDYNGSDGDDGYHLRPSGTTERHFSDCQPYQRIAGRYRKRGASGVPQKQSASFSGSAAGKHQRALHHHSREALFTVSNQKHAHHSAESNMAAMSNKESSQHEGSRVPPDYPSLNHNTPAYPRMQKPSYQHQQTLQQFQSKQGIQRDETPNFFLSDSISLPPSPEVGVSAAMFIPAMATNLLPFPLPVQSSVTFSQKPVTKQQARQLAVDPDTGAEQDKGQGESGGTTPRKKKTSLVALVRGRRSDKGKSKGLWEGKHNRSLSLNRSAGSRRGKVVTLKHQRSKEI